MMNKIWYRLIPTAYPCRFKFLIPSINLLLVCCFIYETAEAQEINEVLEVSKSSVVERRLFTGYYNINITELENYLPDSAIVYASDIDSNLFSFAIYQIDSSYSLKFEKGILQFQNKGDMIIIDSMFYRSDLRIYRIKNHLYIDYSNSIVALIDLESNKLMSKQRVKILGTDSNHIYMEESDASIVLSEEYNEIKLVKNLNKKEVLFQNGLSKLTIELYRNYQMHDYSLYSYRYSYNNVEIGNDTLSERLINSFDLGEGSIAAYNNGWILVFKPDGSIYNIPLRKYIIKMSSFEIEDMKLDGNTLNVVCRVKKHLEYPLYAEDVALLRIPLESD